AYGKIGVKVWIFKGEILEHDPMAQDKRSLETGESRERRDRDDRGPRGPREDRPPGDRPRRGRRPSRDESGSESEAYSTMMQPKKTKFRRAHKGRIKGNTKGGSALNFGQFGLKALEPNRVNAREIEAARRAITREMKRQ